MVTATLVAVAVGAAGAAAAEAAVVTRTDDTEVDFAAGTPTDTVVRGTGAAAGVELTRTLDETFEGTALPTGWTSMPWPSNGTAAVAGGSVLVDGTLLDSGVSAGLGSTLQFTADFGADPFIHAGFATDFDAAPWAIFSTGGGVLATGLYARTSDGAGTVEDTPVTVTPGAHTYRIDWTATGFTFSVDGSVVATQTIALTAPMHAAASDYNAGGAGVSIDAMAMGSTTTGTFKSRALDAGDGRVTGLALTPASDTPTGTGIALETRTAATEAELDGASWTALGAGGTVAGAKQFVQYRATLTTSNPAVTPRLDKVDAAFTIDDVNPAVAIQGVDVSGKTAKVTFTSDPGTTTCSLDHGAAAITPCSSGDTFSGLADGAYVVTVATTDGVGNVGSATKPFTVDTVAPTVSIGGVAVTGTTAKVAFSTDDPAATTACKLDGGAFAACMSGAEFPGLAAGAHTIVVQATDTHGNTGTATRAFDVAAPPAGGGNPTPGGGGTTPPAGGGNTPPAADTSKPAVLVLGRSLKVSKRGVAKLRVRCPRSEDECAVIVKVKQHGKRIARKRLTVSSGSTRTFRLRLSHAARAKLAARGKIKAKAVVKATDAAGNRKTTTRRITLRAPAV